MFGSAGDLSDEPPGCDSLDEDRRYGRTPRAGTARGVQGQGIVRHRKTALITGAATGIGMALAQRLDREGWSVFAGVHRSTPEALVAGCSDRLVVTPIDVSDPEQIAQAARAGERAVGERGLELRGSNAGRTGARGPPEVTDSEALQVLHAVNVL